VGRSARSDTADAHVTPSTVARRELFDLLAEARRVTLVSAPAGSGKTSLLRAWIGDAGLDESAAWVAVERGEEDPKRFWLSVDEMKRVLKPGGVIAVACWAPDGSIGRMVRVTADLLPPPPGEPPGLWGTEDHVRKLFSGSGLNVSCEKRMAVYPFHKHEVPYEHNELRFRTIVETLLAGSSSREGA